MGKVVKPKTPQEPPAPSQITRDVEHMIVTALAAQFVRGGAVDHTLYVRQSDLASLDSVPSIPGGKSVKVTFSYE